VCADCNNFSPIDFRILVIKLDAMGDVLRTTCILPGLKERYPRAHITWITREASIPLLVNNPFVDACWSVEMDAWAILATEEYDLVLSLDAAPMSARLASVARGRERRGFGFDQRGWVTPLGSDAEKWFLMGINDDLKKRNGETYQSIILRICGLETENYGMTYRPTQEEVRYAERFADDWSLARASVVIGLNTGAGGRWRWKRWTREAYRGLIAMVLDRMPGVRILLYGGPEEAERNRYLKEHAPSDSVIDVGCDHSLRNFGALIGLSDVVVTGDTLAMHIAIAFQKRVAVLFGPTSSTEIDVYGRGEKIVPTMDCVVCYKSDCDVSPKCMEVISVQEVFDSVQRMVAEVELAKSSK